MFLYTGHLFCFQLKVERALSHFVITKTSQSSFVNVAWVCSFTQQISLEDEAPQPVNTQSWEEKQFTCHNLGA